MDVKGTLVGETRPTVYNLSRVSQMMLKICIKRSKHTLNGAKMRDEFEVGLAEAATDKPFWRFDKGPSGFE